MKKETALLKKEKLLSYLKGLDSLLVAYSGGVDSTFLLAAAHQALKDLVLAITADSIIHPSKEILDAKTFAEEKGISHIIIPFDAIHIKEFLENSPDRCYFCKKALFEKLLTIAKENDIKYIAHAANLDDMKDFRPGQKAAEELNIIAPLVSVEMNKEEIRFLSREMGLVTWDKPSMACLASRIPYGDSITEDILRMIDKAESFLSSQGFRQYRVRFHKGVARIEVEQSEIKRIVDDQLRPLITDKLRDMGFRHVAVDLEGFVSGSMNRSLDFEE